ncbi:hypothetical protein BDV09DRAFT_195211 [Aspergillus tetrazonus]
MHALLLGGRGKTSIRIDSLFSEANVPFAFDSRTTSLSCPYDQVYFDWGDLNAPGQQSMVFIEPPQWAPRFTDSSTSGRFFRTGDMAQRTEDGSIILKGRKNGFTKVHGLRIELDEIQRCIDSELPPEKRSAVIASEPVDGGKDPEIVAFLEHDQPGGDARLADTMSEELARVLPHYMIPTVFVPIHSLPLTNSKKVDKMDLQKRFARFMSERW